ncbi:MAG: DinB family protein [Planctomycetales bacterium]|nr:DinB family protein [Planctomycetales bacterium]
MSLVDTFLPEFEQEMKGTRSILKLVPDRLLAWKAHDSLNSIGWVASHLVDTLTWIEPTLQTTSFDISPPGGEPYSTPLLNSQEEILVAFDKNLATACELISSASDEDLAQPWTLLQSGTELFTMPRIAVLKSFGVNHVIHHRAFLIAYLRMNDIQCPGLYG